MMVELMDNLSVEQWVQKKADWMVELMEH